MIDQPILEVKNVSKYFKTEKKKVLRAVEDISLSLYPGECLAVVGESGCGKSTLAEVIAGIKKADKGRVCFLGEDITEAKNSQLRNVYQKMQFVFQNPVVAFSPRMKVGTFLREPFLNYHIKKKKEIRQEIIHLLERVELDASYMNKYPHQLSGGELQRIVIARALSLHPALLICDEATSALDVSIQNQIMHLLKRLQQEEQIAILFICHDLALVQQFSDRVMVMYLGSTVETMKNSQLKAAVHPYTIALMNSVFTIQDDRSRKIQVLEGETPDPMQLPAGCLFSGRCGCAREKCFQERPMEKERNETHKVSCFYPISNRKSISTVMLPKSRI